MAMRCVSAQTHFDYHRNHKKTQISLCVLYSFDSQNGPNHSLLINAINAKTEKSYTLWSFGRSNQKKYERKKIKFTKHAATVDVQHLNSGMRHRRRERKREQKICVENQKTNITQKDIKTVIKSSCDHYFDLTPNYLLPLFGRIFHSFDACHTITSSYDTEKCRYYLIFFTVFIPSSHTVAHILHKIFV